mgnify:FL=1
MKEIMDEAKIVSVLEIKICMQILNGQEWNYFPVSQTGESLEKRITEAFLRLVEMGFLQYETGGYTQTVQMKKAFGAAVKPEFTVRIMRKASMPVVISGNRNHFMVMEQVAGQDGMIRLYPAEEEWLWKYLTEEMEKKAEVLDAASWETLEQAETLLHIYRENEEQVLAIWKKENGRVFLVPQEEQEIPLSREEMWQQIEG